MPAAVPCNCGLLIYRPVVNTKEISDLALNLITRYKLEEAQLVRPEKMHITIAYSRTPLSSAHELRTEQLYLTNLLATLRIFDKGSIVLAVDHNTLTQEWQELYQKGAKWSYSQYSAHISLATSDEDALTKLPFNSENFNVDLVLGPQQFKPLF